MADKPATIHIDDLPSVSRLFEEVLFVLLQPTAAAAADSKPAFQTHRNIGPTRIGGRVS